MMDALVSAALHEIAVEGTQGCSLQKLWAGLQAAAAAAEIELDARGKQLLWQQVLNVPGMSLTHPKSPGLQTLVAEIHPPVHSVEDAEKRGLHVVAPEGLRESCLGLYDGKLCDAAISRDQHELLERLAKARGQGVTQSQLGKDFKTGGNKMFYVVRSLEARGLVVRHATIVRTHPPTGKGASNKFVPIVATNLVHLTRYVKDTNMGSHMRFEIPSSSKSNLSTSRPTDNGDVTMGEEDANQATDEVLINDDYPAMQRICEKLEAADDKVLVVSDLKLGLNYRFAQGHRSWRRLAKRLQDAGIVEIFNAQIAGSKIVPCIRLLKSFNAKAFNPGNDDAETEAQLRGVKRGQVTEQVVESVLDRQIYDLVDTSGPAGVYMMDIWKQLGLNNKRNYFRVTNMLAKGCIVSEAEQHKKSMLYRLRTASNATLASNPKVPDDPGYTEQEPQSIVPLAQIAPPPATRIRRPRKAYANEKENEVDKEREGIQSSTTNQELGLLDAEESQSLALVDLSSVKVDEAEPFTVRSGQMYPSPLQTTTAIQRELRIMQRLHEEKFIPRVELHRWIEESEKDRKDTMMDRKTLTRLLQKLQREGRVKCIILSMPGLTNCGRSRTSEVVLLPEVKVEPELLEKVHDRIRQFDMINRGYGSTKTKADASTVPVLTMVKQIHKSAKRKSLPVVETEAEQKARTLSENGFIPAKMVRVRMLHNFLWTYVNEISEYADEDLVMKAGESSCRVFTVALAMQAMPVELFLQVIGSTKTLIELEPYCNKDLRISDLPEADSSSLFGSHANSRLSWLIDVLRRLKLVRLVMGTGIPLGRSNVGFSRTSRSSPEAALMYAMEVKPYIEEPAPQPLSSLSLDAFDLTPRARHEFQLNTVEGLEAYWQTLEYCFSGAMPTIARRAFPGSNVPELFGLRSWTSLRLMTLDQRRELMRRVEEGGLEKRMTVTECASLARELDLSVEQVLRVSYEKNRRCRLQTLEKEILNDPSGESDNEVTVAGKGHRIRTNIHAARKRAVTNVDIMEVAHVKAYKRQRQLEQVSASLDQEDTSVLLKPLITSEREEDAQKIDEDDGYEEGEEEDKGMEENPLNILNAATKLKPARRKRFCWSEDLDRTLIICYCRQRAILGKRNPRVEWAAMPSLPAHPISCRRRIAQLKMEPSVRKSLMSLCSLLSKRYLKHLDLVQENRGRKTKQKAFKLNVAQPPLFGLSSGKCHLADDEHQSNPDLANIIIGEDMAWDSVEDPPVTTALNEVVQLRNIAKALNSRKSAQVFRASVPKLQDQQLLLEGGSEYPESAVPASLSPMMIDYPIDSGTSGSANPDYSAALPAPVSAPVPFPVLFPVPSPVLFPVPFPVPFFNVDPLAVSSAAGYLAGIPRLDGAQLGQSTAPSSTPVTRGKQKTTRLRPRKKSSMPVVMNRMTSEEMVQRSLGVANAVELVKLVLLNASESTDVPLSMVNALRRCEESHVFAAFNFLRNRELVVVGANKQPFLLSAKFFDKAAASRFPFGTGDEARSMNQWLADHNSALDQKWVPLPTDNYCGQLIQLLGVISEGTVNVAPFLPKGGVGESDDNKNIVLGVKRKPEGGQEVRFVKPKIQRADASTPGFRRERGFPGIKVCLQRVAKPVGEMVVAATSDGFESGSEPRIANVEINGSTVEGAGSLEERDTNSTEKVASDQAMEAEAEMSPELVECISHFCSSKSGISSANECPKLKPSLLKAAAHAIQQAGNEGLSFMQLSNSLKSAGLEVNEELTEACVNALESFELVKQVNAFDHVRVIAEVHSGPFFLEIATRSPESGSLSNDTVNEERSSALDTLTSVANGSRNWSGFHSQTQDSSSGHRRVLLSTKKSKNTEVIFSVPVLPWLNGGGGMKSLLFKSLARRVLGIVMLNPGISEEKLVEQLNVLNPQTARKLLSILESDGHLNGRKSLQPKQPAPPRLFGHLIKSDTSGVLKPKFRTHYFANSTSAILL